MPKLLLLGTNDPYWVVDALRNYWNDLPEPKLVFQTPNAGHDLGGGRQATQTLAAFFQVIADREPLPKMNWEFKQPSTNRVSIGVDLDRPAKAFHLWTASSTNRDFRKAGWSSAKVASSPGTHVVATVEKPEMGFRAYLLEAEMKTSSGQTYKLSTEARVIPDGAPPREGERTDLKP
jgi:PhoPQ-activated pathogenicity-related protein